MNAMNKIRTWLAERKYDGVVLSRRDHYAWITGGAKNHVLSCTETGVAHLLITEDEILLFADCSDALRMDEEQNPLGAKRITVPWYESVEEKISETIGSRNIGSDTGISDTVNVHLELVMLRLTLSEGEIERYRSLGQMCAKIVEGVCQDAKRGQTETEIAGQIKKKCVEQQINPDCVLVGSDERLIRYRHPMPTEKKIEQSLMVVLGGEKYGLNISMTRMVQFGTIPAETAWKYRKVQEIFAAMQFLLKDGLGSSDYFKQVIALYEKNGYGEKWKLHHQGGVTGYGCREEIMSPKSRSVIKFGQAFALNPTITGVKCEETTLFKPSGIEIFTRTNRWPIRQVETPEGVLDVAEILSK